MASGSGTRVEVTGLIEMVQALNGPVFKKVNSELRDRARFIADGIVPEVRDALRLSRAPQAAAFQRTVASKRDRVPVVRIGATNPGLKKFSRRGPRRDGRDRLASNWRRGAMAYGIVFGANTRNQPPRVAPPAAGDRRRGNPYRTLRTPDGGAVMRDIHKGRAYRAAADEYRKAYRKVLLSNGFEVPR